MGKVLIIGAGGVGTVVAHKVAQNPDVFTEIMIASRTDNKNFTHFSTYKSFKYDYFFSMSKYKA